MPEQTPLKALTSSAVSLSSPIHSNASGVPTTICNGGPVTSDLDAAAAASGSTGVAAPEIVQFGEPKTSSESSIIELYSVDTSVIAPSTPIIDKSQKIVPSCPVKIHRLSSILPGTKSKPNSNNCQANIPFPTASIDVPSASVSTPELVTSNATTNAELSSEFDRTSEEIRAYWSLAWNHSNWLPDHAQEILGDTSMMKKAFPGNLAMLCSYDRMCKRLIQLQYENPGKAREIYQATLTAAANAKKEVVE